jgi:hypothetical protein
MLVQELLSDTKTKKHPPEGLFDSGSPKKIADWALSSHNGNLRKAMASLNFYLNRGGSNIPGDQKERVQKAKDILSKKSD